LFGPAFGRFAVRGEFSKVSIVEAESRATECPLNQLLRVDGGGAFIVSLAVQLVYWRYQSKPSEAYYPWVVMPYSDL